MPSRPRPSRKHERNPEHRLRFSEPEPVRAESPRIRGRVRAPARGNADVFGYAGVHGALVAE